MYLKTLQSSISAKKFVIPNEIQLDENNQWVIMADLIPWQDFEQKYADIFDEKLGAPAKPFRMALGALIIQQIKNLTDRQTVEEIRDKLHNGEAIKVGKKPRTDRESARKNYLNVAKKKKPRKEERREAIRLQLRYISKNLKSIEKLNNQGISLLKLSKKEYKILLVVAEVYRQQKEMYEEEKNRIDNRIVSITQPHIRPIVRGKAGSAVEFGAKISVSIYENYVFLDKLSWENFNESRHLIEQVEKYHELINGILSKNNSCRSNIQNERE